MNIYALLTIRLMKQLQTEHLTADDDCTIDRYPTFCCRLPNQPLIHHTSAKSGHWRIPQRLTAELQRLCTSGCIPIHLYITQTFSSTADTSFSLQMWSVVTSPCWPLRVANLVNQQGNQQRQAIDNSTLAVNEITLETHEQTVLVKKKWCHLTYYTNTIYLTNHFL